MKALTFIATAALAIAGTACGSGPSETEITEAVTPPPVAKDEVGEFNFSLGGVSEEEEVGFNFSLDDDGSDELLIGGEGIVDTDFGDTPDLGLNVEGDIEIPALEDDPDAIIRVE